MIQYITVGLQPTESPGPGGLGIVIIIYINWFVMYCTTVSYRLVTAVQYLDDSMKLYVDKRTYWPCSLR